jgi:hypothetical protein
MVEVTSLYGSGSAQRWQDSLSLGKASQIFSSYWYIYLEVMLRNAIGSWCQPLCGKPEQYQYSWLVWMIRNHHPRSGEEFDKDILWGLVAVGN